ncbi:hypothetical protein GYMLUDRAFT_242088 [Collybiopsis luxurians FD-317 M1]|uniref:Uncharacterized protein n=1 Tax=Collybiopsis luxurians FD-317 M1 TaxID=944289 RepID=A0A0D0CJP9_9AGAR|nr:hypothetical protein GYMLUDRAFT_242088 [Collybiopsis luxurians FD-317 M1]
MDSEFVHLFKRRRRRRTAVDPCLGFYTEEQDVHRSLLSDPNPTFQQSSINANPVEYAQNSGPAQSEITNSTEQTTKKLKTYAKKRLQPQETQVNTTPPESPSPVPPKRRKLNPLRVHSPPDDSATRPRISNRKRKQPLAARLLQAAVTSGVDPTDNLIEPNPDAPAPTRKPLQFQVSESLDDSSSSSKRRPSWERIDPHESSWSIRSASFISSREKKTLSTPRSIHKPFTQWPNNSFRSNPDSALKKNTVMHKADAKLQSKRLPLKLVPVHESELVTRQSSRIVHPDRCIAGSNQVAHSTPGTDNLTTETSLLPLKFVPIPVSTSARSAMNNPSSTSHPNSASLVEPTTVIHVGLPNKTDPVSNSCSANPFAIPLSKILPAALPEVIPEPSSDPIDATSSASGTLAINQEDVISSSLPNPAHPISLVSSPSKIHTDQPNACSSPFHPTINADHSSENEPSLNIFLSPSHPPTNSLKKPEKPLSFFLDEFLETVRTAASESQRRRFNDISGRRRRPTRASSHGAEWGLHPSALRSNSIAQDPGNADPLFDPLFDELPYTRIANEEKEDSSELMSGLQPSQYRITLTSESPPGENSLHNAMAGLRAFYR